MNDLRTAAQQALEALELYVPKEDYENKPVGNVMDALRAALAEPVQEPYTRERHFALCEAHCIAAADAFWKARPGTKDDGRAIAFDAGLVRGFDRGAELEGQRLAALAEPVQEPAPMPPFPPVSLWKRGCAVCGIGAGGHAYGYACPRSDCPTRVTCGGTV